MPATRTRWTGNCDDRARNVLWSAFHTEEGNSSAWALAGYCQSGNSEVSYHDVIDDQEWVAVVPWNLSAWCLLNGNGNAVNAVFAGSRAAWSRATWLSHDGMMRLGAQWLVETTARFAIPREWGGAQAVRDRRKAVIDHWSYTIGARDGSHTDCGDGFPDDVIVSLARGTVSQLSPDDDPLWRSGVLTQLLGPFAA